MDGVARKAVPGSFYQHMQCTVVFQIYANNAIRIRRSHCNISITYKIFISHVELLYFHT